MCGCIGDSGFAPSAAHVSMASVLKIGFHHIRSFLETTMVFGVFLLIFRRFHGCGEENKSF